jgi:hypothetical protein
MKKRTFTTGLILLTLIPATSQGQATKVAREAAEYLMRKFGKDVAEESVVTLTRKIETLVAKHGNEALLAVRKVGPRAFHIVEDAGERGLQAIQLMAKYGEAGVWVASNPKRLGMFVKWGHHAAESLIKHGEIAEPLLDSFGQSGANALSGLSSRNARRLAMMAQDHELEQIGRTSELLDVVARYGDRAMDFIWKHKGSLTITAGLTAFVAHPEPFLSGAKDIGSAVAQRTVKPIVEVPGQVARAAAANTNWTVVLVTIVLAAAAAWGMRVWLHHRLLILRQSDGDQAKAR